MRVPWEILEHPADVGFLAYGATPEELFTNAALAMISLGCDPAGVEEREWRQLEASGADLDALLYAWLAEILAVADAEQLVFCRVEVSELALESDPARETPAAGRVRGIAYGEKFDKARHRAGTYIKAVTYHQLCVEQTPEGWRAQVFLDV
ncbi:MAG: archease [Acidobacteria bacterium]|nr:archease [Acidobacteriota bacterium]